MGIGFVAEVGVFRTSASAMAGFAAGFNVGFDTFLAIETGTGDFGELTCVWGWTEVVREAGRGLEGAVDFKPPGKAIGEIGFGDLISGLGFWRATEAGGGVLYLASTGDF
jgi:hypothetical protein